VQNKFHNLIVVTTKRCFINKHQARFKQHGWVAIILVIFLCMARLSVNAQQRSNEKNKIRYTLPDHSSNTGLHGQVRNGAYGNR
jgi:hypothetical protein